MKRLLVLLLLSTYIIGYAQQENVDLQLEEQIELKTHFLNFEQIHKKLFEKTRNQAINLSIDFISLEPTILTPSDLMSLDFATANPSIRVYKWKDSQSFGTVTISDEDLYISKMEDNKLSALYPSKSAHNLYYISTENDSAHKKHVCSTIPSREDLDRLRELKAASTSRALIQNGSILRTYRLAAVVTGEYYQANGGNNTAVNTHLLGSVAGIQAIFENDLAVNFEVLTPVLYSDPSSDPFVPDMTSGDPRPTQAQIEIAAQFNTNQYDIGHVFHNHQEDDNWSTGGIAGLGVVCRDQGDAKARGWSGSFNNNGVSWFQLAAHEFAHMFSAQHTFNGDGDPTCDDAISDDTAYEIGSGTTIMSYQGLCNEDQNIASSGAADSYFHAHSLIQMINYMETFGTCANQSPTNNQSPDININPCNTTYKIPKNTPFIMSAEASDPDGDLLTYVWEQYDEDGDSPNHPTQGFIGGMAASSPIAPLFRSLPPSTDISRSFPLRSTVIQGNTSDPFQVLPGVPRTLNFKLTARDNQIGGGTVAIEDRQVEVVDAGPFRVTTPNSNITTSAGQTLDITWSIAGSEEVCNVVDIYLSTDGGISNNFLLANDILYADGTATVNIPAALSSTSTARIVIICDDNECLQIFDISDSDFNITSDCQAYNSYVCNTDPLTADQGDPVLDLMMNNTFGIVETQMSRTVSASSSTMQVAIYNETETGCSTVSNFFYESIEFNVTETGVYRFDVDVNAGGAGAFGLISIFETSAFTPNNPCPSFVGSSARSTNGGSAATTGFAEVALEACKSYTMALYNFPDNLPNITTVESISGPGDLLTVDINVDFNYATTYAAINTSNDIVAAVSPTGDFTTLAGGSYQVYSIIYKATGPTPPNNVDPDTWVGASLNQLIFTGNCILRSNNFKPIEVNSSCSIDMVDIGFTGSCDPETNFYEQDIIITYNSDPGSGSIIVNDLSFPITSSPQGVVLENLISDGMPVDITVSFSDDPSCETIFTDVYTAPENCCPIDLDLGEDFSACSADDITLDAGPDGVNYIWSINDVVQPEVGQTIAVDQSGTYKVEVRNESGCIKTDMVQAIINASPMITLDANSSACEGSAATLDPMIGNPSFTYEWALNGNFAAGSEVIDVTIPGEYCITVTNIADCTATACTQVTFVTPPTVDLGDDIAVCGDTEVLLDAGSTGLTYAWSKDGVMLDETTPTINPTITGVYAVTVSEGQCTATDEVNVIITPTPVFTLGDDQAICAMESVSITISDIYDGYTWFLDGTEFTSTGGAVHFADAGGEYVVEVFDENCTYRDTVIVTERENPALELGEDKIGCIGSPVLLDSGNPNTMHSWSQDGSVLSETESVIMVNDVATYAVTVTDDEGCSSTDEVSVNFEPGPTLDIGDDIDLCDGQVDTIFATTNGDNISWLRDGIEITGETDTELEVTTGGVYTAQVTGASGCEVEDQITVNLFTVPNIDLGEDQTICEGDEFTFTAGDDTNSYLWLDDDGMTVSQIETLTTGSAGIYTVFVTTMNQCLVTDEVELIVTQLPILTLPVEAAFCEDQSTMIDAGGDAESYSWTLNGSTINGESSSMLEISEEGTYTVTAANGNNCLVMQDIIVTEENAPTVNLGDDQEICPGEILTLDAGDGIEYIWSSGEDTRMISIDYADLSETAEHIFTVTVTNNIGCTAEDEITITRLTFPAPIVDDETTICAGETAILTVEASDGSPTDQFTWTGPEGTLITSEGTEIEVMPTEPISIYEVTAVNGCGVSDQTALITVVLDTPSDDLSAGRDTCVIEGRSIELSATGGLTYNWSDDGSFIGSTTIANPEVAPLAETTYTVSITNAEGCTYEDQVNVCIITDPFTLLKPVSLITPNDDGKNDVLIFNGLEAFPNNRLRVYNRWGVTIFDRAGYQNGSVLFDGIRSGELLPADTYYYILEIDEKVVFKSDLTIIRD